MVNVYALLAKAMYLMRLTTLFETCPHGCRYCYVLGQLHLSPEEYFGPARVRKNLFQDLEREIPKVDPAKWEPPIHLCWHGDPYPSEIEGENPTRRALELFKHGSPFGPLKVDILTKGGTRVCRDYNLLTPGEDHVGATLTFIDPVDSLKWEPGAALPDDRLSALREAHERGIGTWASMVPIIDPAQTLELIESSYPFVDSYFLARGQVTNPGAAEIDWSGYYRKLDQLLTRLKVDYRIQNPGEWHRPVASGGNQ